MTQFIILVAAALVWGPIGFCVAFCFLLALNCFIEIERLGRRGDE